MWVWSRNWECCHHNQVRTSRHTSRHLCPWLLTSALRGFCCFISWVAWAGVLGYHWAGDRQQVPRLFTAPVPLYDSSSLVNSDRPDSRSHWRLCVPLLHRKSLSSPSSLKSHTASLLLWEVFWLLSKNISFSASVMSWHILIAWYH